jgi:hypothetical protein
MNWSKIDGGVVSQDPGHSRLKDSVILPSFLESI